MKKVVVAAVAILFLFVIDVVHPVPPPLTRARLQRPRLPAGRVGPSPPIIEVCPRGGRPGLSRAMPAANVEAAVWWLTFSAPPDPP